MELYQHYKNGKQYHYLGIARFGSTNDTLTQVGTAHYSENPDTLLAVYHSTRALLLHLVDGPEPNTNIDYVIYQALYHSPEFGDNVLWARPSTMFFEEVEHEGKRVPRFRKVTTESDPHRTDRTLQQ